MVRPIDSDMVFISPLEASPRRAENSFEGFEDAAHSLKFIPVNDIPGLWTRDDVARKTIKLDIPQKRNPSLKQFCYVAEGNTSLYQLSVVVPFYSLEFSVEGNSLPKVPINPKDAAYSELPGRKRFNFKVYPSVKVPVITSDIIAEEVPYPPFPIRSWRQAKKASMMRKGGSYGSRVFVYGTYGDVDIQF